MTDRPARPAYTGIEIYRNLEQRYSFLYPTGWHLLDLETDAEQGVILSPTPDDTTTSFSVEVRDLGITVTADDLPDLRAGFEAGLADYADAVIENQEEFAVDPLYLFEAWLTYRDGDAIRKRWVRLLYQGSTQARIIAQGASITEYEYWLPMLTQQMRSFQFADWWADVTGFSWLPSLTATFDDEGEGPSAGVKLEQN